MLGDIIADSRATSPGIRIGGRRAAAIYSLIESAKLNALNPQHYPADLLARIADHPARRIADSCPGTGNRSTPPALPPKPGHSPSAYDSPRTRSAPNVLLDRF